MYMYVLPVLMAYLMSNMAVHRFFPALQQEGIWYECHIYEMPLDFVFGV